MGRRLSVILLVSAGLAACDAGPKAAGSHPAAVTPAAAVAEQREAQSSSSAYSSDRRRDQPVRLLAGKPVWTSNRRMSAEENARSHFERDGADFDARTLEDFLGKAHAFTAKPPKGAKTIARPNGDLLIYDEKTNTFAVVARSGAPRTMFKPRNGREYWDEQVRKERERFRDH